MLEENIKGRGKAHALMWEVYKKEKEKFIKREFLAEVPHPKMGKIVWTCVNDNIIEEKKANKEV